MGKISARLLELVSLLRSRKGCTRFNVGNSLLRRGVHRCLNAGPRPRDKVDEPTSIARHVRDNMSPSLSRQRTRLDEGSVVRVPQSLSEHFGSECDPAK